MPDDLAQRAARHRYTMGGDQEPRCMACGTFWPCDAAQRAAAEARITKLERVAKAARDFATVVGPRGGYLTVYTALADALAALDTDA
jgi:hypothetical protein